MDRVTVIIPYKKDRGFLDQAIASVPDGVELITAKGEGTWPHNFNAALKEATGDYIKYLHDDDMLTANCIDDSVNALKKGYDFIHGNAYNLYPDKITEFRPHNTNPTIKDLIVRNMLYSPTFMYRKEVFEIAGTFDEDLQTCEEFEFTLRCLSKGLKLGYVDSFLAYYRIHPDQKTNKIKEARRAVDRDNIRRKYENI